MRQTATSTSNQILSGKLKYVNAAKPGSKADSIVLEDGDGTQTRICLPAGQSSNFIGMQGTFVSVTITKESMSTDGKTFLWSDAKFVSLGGGSPSTNPTETTTFQQQSQVKNQSIAYQGTAKAVIPVLVHNAQLSKKQLTIDDIHQFVYQLYKISLDPEAYQTSLDNQEE